MLKGAIEDVTSQTVSGWIYSPMSPLRDTLILAFSGEACIGTGRIDRFRQDLADAGLDDGYLGFNFPITLPQGADVASVVVRLDGAEAVLLQRASRIGGAEATHRASAVSVEDQLRRIRWLRRRNIIAGTEYDFLRGLARFGVYEIPIDIDPANPQTPEETAASLARKLLELTVLNEVTLKLNRVSDGDSLVKAIGGGADQASGVEHVVLWSPVPTRIGVVEGGHLGGGSMADGAGAVDYHLDASNILVVHSDCAVVARPGSAYRAITVMSGGAGADIAEPVATPQPEPARPVEEVRPARATSGRR